MKTPIAIIAGLLIIAAAIYYKPEPNRYQYNTAHGTIAIMDRHEPRIIAFDPKARQWQEFRPMEIIAAQPTWTPPATDPIIRPAGE